MKYNIGDLRYSRNAGCVGVIKEVLPDCVLIKYDCFKDDTTYSKENTEKYTKPVTFPAYFKDINSDMIVSFITPTSGTVVEQKNEFSKPNIGYKSDIWVPCYESTSWTYLPDYKEKEAIKVLSVPIYNELTQIAKILIDEGAAENWLNEVDKKVDEKEDKYNFSDPCFMTWENTPQGGRYWARIYTVLIDKNLSAYQFSYNEMKAKLDELMNKSTTNKIKIKRTDITESGNPINLTKKDTFMSKLKNNVTSTLSQNKEAFSDAAKLKAGQVINKQLIKQIKPNLPMMVRGYAEHPLAEVVLANVAAIAVKQFMPDNSKLNKVADLMLGAAAYNTIDSFNIEALVNDVLSKVKLPEGILDDAE